MRGLEKQFLLDPGIVYLNHGSFGATPEPVFRNYQRWQRELELQPTEFLGRRHNDLMRTARTALATYVGAASEEVVFTQNVTQAVNIVARSMRLGPGDEVLSSDHEYGACDRVWRFLSRKRGFAYIRQAVRVPPASAADLVEDFLRGVTERTRIIFISHITSTTAVVFPVEEICRRARLAGILTIVDGAHAPGQLALDLASLGADFYGGNLHKWLCAPKGAGFLYARPQVQYLLEPLVVSWGYEAEQPSGSTFIDQYEWWGTRDIAAFLAVPSAIDFQQQHNWPEVRAECHHLLQEALTEIAKNSGVAGYYPDDSWYAQMGSARLPGEIDPARFQAELHDKYRVEIPVLAWNDWKLMRVSVQAYNSHQDIERLLEALKQLLSK